MTYSAPMYADVEFRYGNHTVKKNMFMGLIPIMLKSSHCILYQKNEEEMAKLQECPLDPGGYFIISGSERVLLMQEQIMNNRMILDKNSDGTYSCGVVRYQISITVPHIMSRVKISCS